MKYLPIFQALFKPSNIFFILIGLVFAVFIGIKMNTIKQNIIGLVSCFALYIVCELVSNIFTNYMIILVLLFFGTFAIGGIIGFLISTIVVKLRQLSRN